jgi:hypothetical protein
MESKGYHIYWPSKWRISVERNITFAPMEVMVDVLDEGEPDAVKDNEYNNNNNIKGINIPSI